jgi:transposase
VAAWVACFNREGLAAVMPRHGDGPPIRYGAAEQRRILEEAQRAPDRARDGTAIWSLSTLQCALRRAKDGLPRVSTYTIWQTLHAAGLSWQQSRTWCATGMAVRQRKPGGAVVVRDPDGAEKTLIERAYARGTALGLGVWCEDEAGPPKLVEGPSRAPSRPQLATAGAARVPAA